MFLLAYNSILDSMSMERKMEYNLEFSQSTTLDAIWDRSKGKPLIILVILSIAIIFLCVMSDDSPPVKPSGKNDTGHGNRTIGLYENVNITNCTPPPIDSFPQDVFTQEERRHGFVMVHIAVSIYVFYCLAIMCDEYLVPSIDCICKEYHVSANIAAATFMAIATSSPELFTNVIGTFVTKGDIGVGTVLGSAIINVLGVCGLCGIATKNPLPLDVYPLTRDCLFYSVTVILLVFVMRNEQIFWHEALVLVLAYAIYMLVMLNNATVKRKLDNIIGKIRSALGLDSKPYDEEDMNLNSNRMMIGNSSLRSERTPLMGGSKDEDDEEIFMSNILYRSRILPAAGEAEAKWSLIKPPALEKGVCSVILWVMSWPPRFVFTFTIPDCRKENWRKFSIITLSVCVLWIAASSYLISWMMTVIGHTLSVSNSLMGLVFLAIGATTPELVSSIIVARQGHGTMSISNSLGSNIFNILICLGLPWLIRSSMIAGDAKNYIQINSGGLEYSVASLLLAVFLLYVILAANRFYLDRKVGLIALILYCIFILFASLFEMNVFFIVNLPICNHMNN